MNPANDSNYEFSGTQEQITAFVEARNRRKLDEFLGLSPLDMQRLLYFPFESPELLRFAEVPKPEAPALKLFMLLAEKVGEKGVKATTKGNLPQKLSREVAMLYLGEAGYADFTRYGGVNKEEDFYDLHIVRLVAGMAGLIRKYKGSFILSQKCRKLLVSKQQGVIYRLLFEAFVKKFNWGYWDNFADAQILQMASGFHLYMLQRSGQERRTVEFYAEQFAGAFPIVLDELGGGYFPPEENLALCYQVRVLSRFADFFGLVRLHALEPGNPVSPKEVETLPLLAEFVQFNAG
jgi:hypothetical protein